MFFQLGVDSLSHRKPLGIIFSAATEIIDRQERENRYRDCKERLDYSRELHVSCDSHLHSFKDFGEDFYPGVF
jgi:hypothetical protein